MSALPEAALGSAPRTHDGVVYRRAAILLFLCLALAGIASSSALHEALMGVLVATDELISQHPIAGIFTFVALAAVSAMFTFVSIAVLVPAAVFAWGAPATAGLLWLGWIVGGVATYTIGKHIGRPVARSFMASEALQRLESHVPANAPLWLIVLLQLALPSEIPGYVLGLVRYPIASYVAALALAELPYTLATVYLGASFVAGHSAVILGVGAITALFSLAMFYGWRRAMRATRASATAGESRGSER
jgi:uncharacterized membrane protein YdjX (TVP38/TMEM64 family)